MEKQITMTRFSALALTILIALTAPAHADVVLKDALGQFKIEGQLSEFDAETYTIQTELGELIIRREFVSCEGDECPDSATTEIAETNVVVLVSSDQTVRLEGNLLETTATEFVIDTGNGVLRVRREFVACEGASCPSVEIDSVNINIGVDGMASSRLAASIIGDYARTKDFTLTLQFGSESEFPTLLVGDERGLKVASADIKRMATSEAVKALLGNEIAFALTLDQVSAEQISQAAGKPVSDVNDVLQQTVVGLDAVSFFVGENISIDIIHLETIGNILSGEVTNWRQVGTADAPINVHMIAESTDLVDVLKERAVLKGEMLPNVTFHATGEAFAAAVKADPTAFGVAWRSKAANVKALSLATSCQIFADNSDFAVQTEEHPLTVRMYKYELKGAETSEFAANIGRYIVTDFGQESIAATGLVTQALQIAPMQNQGARLLSTVLNGADDPATRRIMRNYLNEASTARRISTSLRFVTGAATLDNKALSDIDRISEIVRSNTYEGYEVLVFGFSDSSGGLEPNISLSQRRADAVHKIILAKNVGYLGAESIRSFGVGPIAPVGCNETVAGREQNRRVEIWLRPKLSL